MGKESEFVEYARLSLQELASEDRSLPHKIFDVLGETEIETVLDVGCGAGKQLIPFAERGSFCVGVDIGAELGLVGQWLFRGFSTEAKVKFLRAEGEELPFVSSSFDVVICQLALPYMDNRKAIAEIGRVLRTGGKLLLKVHAPAFYFWMIKNRLRAASLKQLAYPVICLICGTVNLVTGKHPQGKFWKGKEVYQTKWFLERELKKHDLRIVGELSDTNIATPSYLIEKVIKQRDDHQ